MIESVYNNILPNNTYAMIRLKMVECETVAKNIIKVTKGSPVDQGLYVLSLSGSSVNKNRRNQGHIYEET